MREVPSVMEQRWREGSYIGDSRPVARVTVQQARVALYDSGINTWSSIIFDNPNTPVEITAVKSVDWDRSIDQDAATASIVLWNTADLAVGEQPFNAEELDLPGIYTYQLDGAMYGRLPDDLAQLLVPDNILRTYEGYGFDAGAIPEEDPNLVITGTWMIDSISYGQDGTITCECRDLARILIDQVCYKPVIPDEHYPLRFGSVDGFAGFRPPYVSAGIDDVTGYSTYGYDGPTDPPVITNVTEGSGQVTITFDPPPFDGPEISYLPEGYTADLATTYRAPSGYYVRFDAYDNGDDIFHGIEWYLCSGVGQVNAAIYLYGPATTISDGAVGVVVDELVDLFGGASELERHLPEYAPIGYTVYVSSRLQPIALDDTDDEFTLTGLLNGNVYGVSVAAVWQHFETSAKQTGELTAVTQVRPNGGGAVAVSSPSIGVVPVSGGWRVSWSHDAGATPVTWTIIQYQDYGEEGDFRRVHSDVATTSTSGTAEAIIPSAPGDDGDYSYLVFGRIGGAVGRGGVAFAVTGEAQFYRPPVEAAPPPFDYVSGGGQSTGDPDQVIPRDVVPIEAKPLNTSTYDAFSNPTPDLMSQIPQGGAVGSAEGAEFRNAQQGTDEDLSKFWTSAGFATPQGRPWLEVGVANVTVARVRVFMVGKPYQLWVSVYAGGSWRSYDASHRIPGGGIPYLHQGATTEEGPTDFYFQVPVANVTKIRLTVSNLAAGEGGLYYAKVRLLEVDTPLVEINEAQDEAYNTSEAAVVGGAGIRPHTYSDYTDIVKLLCAWGGFFWPQDGTIRDSGGGDTPFNFGQAPYNLGDNIDPVLGPDSGRVWGDFEISGTSGVADLPVSQFDKKPLMDAIGVIRNILGFIFYVDEEGGVVWRQINVFRVGNMILTRSTQPGITYDRVVLDEMINLMDLRVSIDSRNVRDKIYVATTNGEHGAVIDGYVANDIGLRRVSGWTDQHFQSDRECLGMAQMIAIRQMFTYRSTDARIPGFPKIQINDQIQIRERIAQEDFLHFVSGISSSNDLTTGQWTYDLTTHWLGTDPEDGVWAIDIAELAEPVSASVQAQAQAAGIPTSYRRPGT